MILKLIKPILAKTSLPVSSPAPSVVVTAKAELEYNQALRAQMKKKVWEKDGGVSWYVDQDSGLCTVSSSFVRRFEEGELMDGGADALPVESSALLVEECVPQGEEL